MSGADRAMLAAAEIPMRINEFKALYGLHRIVAFAGGADDELYGVDDPDLKSRYSELMLTRQRRVIEQVIQRLQHFNIAVLTGGTEWGLPNTATTLAAQYGLRTIGVFPFTAHEKVLWDQLDLPIAVEPMWGNSQWGDESPLLANLLDGVVVYGGGAGTLVEIAHVLKINEKLMKRSERLKCIVPIFGTGGVADGLPFVWAKPEVRRRSMPEERVLSGDGAAEILIRRLDLDDYPKSLANGSTEEEVDT